MNKTRAIQISSLGPLKIRSKFEPREMKNFFHGVTSNAVMLLGDEKGKRCCWGVL